MVDEPETIQPRGQRPTADQRRRRVAQMEAADYSVRETAKLLAAAGYPNCSTSTIQRDRAKNEKTWRDATVSDMQAAKDRHTQRLDEAIARRLRDELNIGNAVEAGEYYVGVVLPLLKERAKLLGLYAPTRLDVTDYVRNWARDQGYDQDRAVELAQEVIDSTGF